MTVRVRIAPSPTGYFHVGIGRTALYNWLFARHHGGTFIVRSDDTDAERSTQEYQDDILEHLRWLGLEWDEGIEVGGPHAPYRQTLRLERYHEVTDALLAVGTAYPCFCTPAELDERRRAAMAEGRPPGYDGRCRSISPTTALARRGAGEAASVRFAVPRPGATAFRDEVRGEMDIDHANVDDFVILRSDGSPTYHLASSVDDVDFGITHVVRGEDLLSSTPKHILLTEALGGQPIVYAHLSLLMGPDGRKLSKRHGDTAIRAYRERGIIPEAMVNYLALLGWSPGVDETVVALADMVERFELSDVSRNPAIFDPAKLEWMNGVYLRELAVDDFLARTLPLIEADLERGLDDEELARLAFIAPLVQERAKLLTEVAPQVRFLFVDEIGYDEDSWAKVMTADEIPAVLAAAMDRLSVIPEWKTAAIEEALRAMLETLELSPRKGLQPLRVAVSGSSVSPPLFESLEALGRGPTLARLAGAAARL
ncbi:MAG: glutamate--tRNA ligase [Actinobacteria bacterium]|nr:glutamate--tRNA ligase [Actinomycetota bacterium]MBU1494955.1 glutamate--tRNA ligase [Actinomycetota bacterium]